MNKPQLFKVEDWTTEEAGLLDEMKSRCLNKGQYIDEKAKDKFKMLCHLEDYGLQYYEQQKEIEKLNKEKDDIFNKAVEINNKLRDSKNKEIDIMKKYFQMIIDLSYDYDGFNNVEDLKGLIDDLCKYASLGKECNTTEPIYVNGDKKYNILGKELKEGK